MLQTCIDKNFELRTMRLKPTIVINIRVTQLYNKLHRLYNKYKNSKHSDYIKKLKLFKYKFSKTFRRFQKNKLN